MNKKKSSIMDNIIIKFLISLFVFIIGFGYFMFFIYTIYNIFSNPKIEWWWIFPDIFIYIIIFSLPSKIAWKGIESLSKDKIKLKGKIIIMIISQIIGFLYTFFALYEIWISGPNRRDTETKEDKKLNRSVDRSVKWRKLKEKHKKKK